MPISRNKTTATLASCMMLTFASSASAEWLKAESEHFVVYGDTSSGALRSYTQKVERFDRLLRLYFPVQSDVQAPKLPIYLADGLEDMRKVWPDIPSNVGGFYTPNVERIFAVTGGQGSANDRTLFHEYAHHFMHQYFQAAYPGWFVEGFAEYFATADMTPGRTRVGLHSPERMNSLTLGANSWLPMEDVLRSRGAAIGSQGHSYYAQAWALTNYLMSTPERQMMLRRYLATVANGADPVAALDGTINRTPAQLQDDVRRYLGRITFYTLQQDFPATPVEIDRLSSVEQDFVWLDLRLARYVPEDQRAGNLSEAQRLALRHPGDPLAARTVAQAYLDLEQPEKAVEVLEPVVASHPKDAVTLRFLATAMMEAGDAASEAGDPQRGVELYNAARPLLARAYTEDATDYRLYLAMAVNREGAAGYPTENDLQILRLGAALAPQLGALRMRAARAMMHSGHFDEAVAYLAPLANNPHGGDASGDIRTLLEEAQARLAEAAGAEPNAKDTDDLSSQPPKAGAST